MRPTIPKRWNGSELWCAASLTAYSPWSDRAEDLCMPIRNRGAIERSPTHTPAGRHAAIVLKRNAQVVKRTFLGSESPSQHRRANQALR